MNAISKKLFYLKYKELSNLGLSDETIELISKNNTFKSKYKSSIIPLINKYDINTTIIGINALAKLNSEDDFEKCISVFKIWNLDVIAYKVDDINPYVIIDENFNDIYNRLRHKTFSKNIEEIFLNNKSKQLLEFIYKYVILEYQDVSNISNNFIDFIYSEQNINNSSISDYIKDNNFNINLLAYIINNGYNEGLLYTLNNIPEANDYLMCDLKYKNIKQFDMDFINNIDMETIKELYLNSGGFGTAKFENLDKLFKIFDVGNYKLIEDIVNYMNCNFYLVDEENIGKNIYENYSSFEKVFFKRCNLDYIYLNKKLGITKEEYDYIWLDFQNLNKISFTNEFKNKYGYIVDFFNMTFNCDYKKILEIDAKFTKEQIDFIKNNLDEFKEKYHSLHRELFSKDVNNRFVDFNKNLQFKPLKDSNGDNILSQNGNTINVFELNGEQFTMLIHVVPVKKHAGGINNADIGLNLINDPSVWDKQEKGNSMISSSLISNNQMHIFNNYNIKDNVIYGFSNIPSNIIHSTHFGDAGSNMINFPDDDKYYTDNVYQIDKFTNAKDELQGDCYNEVLLNRRNRETKERIKPDYIVCFDEINKQAIKHAQYFNIPIYVINTKIYEEQFSKIKEQNFNNEQLEEEQTNARHI